MGFLEMLTQVIWVGVILSATMAATAMAFSTALPNCSDSCGNVTIPYPYGTTEGCYLNDSTILGHYFINCTTTNVYNQPQPKIGSINVSSISTEEGEIEVRMFNSLDCNDKSGASQKHEDRSLGLSTLTVSAKKNKFVAVGCDTYAYLKGALNGQNFSVGCLSVCLNRSILVNGTCSGIGCCEVSIPEGMKNVDFEAHSFMNHTKVWDFNPCSYAFIVREDEFKFSPDYLISLQDYRAFPLVLDWAIGNEKCEVAQNKANYLCGENTTCSNPENQFGYRCTCKDGYEGNPYLGCQDINECDAKELNNCTSSQYCVNELGSYNCLCLEGLHSYGKACVPDQFASNDSSLTIKLTVSK